MTDFKFKIGDRVTSTLKYFEGCEFEIVETARVGPINAYGTLVKFNGGTKHTVGTRHDFPEDILVLSKDWIAELVLD